MRVRVRVIVPGSDDLSAVGLSALLHVLVVVVALAFSMRSVARPADGPVINVSLAAAPAARTTPAPPAPRRVAPPKPRPAAEEKPAETEAKPKPKTEAKPKLRTNADDPKTVATGEEEATARPTDLPEADEPPPAEPSGPEGSAEGAPIEGGVAGLATDQPFTADWYLQLVVARLQSAWRDRPLLPPGSATRRVVIAFSIERSGRVSGVRVKSPSGYPPLDLSAYRAVDSLVKLPELPRGYEGDALGAQFVFELVAADAP